MKKRNIILKNIMLKVVVLKKSFKKIRNKLTWPYNLCKSPWACTGLQNLLQLLMAGDSLHIPGWSTSTADFRALFSSPLGDTLVVHLFNNFKVSSEPCNRLTATGCSIDIEKLTPEK